MTGLSSEDLEAKMSSLSESSGINDVADTFVESVVDPVANTFSDLVNTGTGWFNKGKGWLKSRRRRDLGSELQPMQNFLSKMLHDFDWLFVAVKTVVSVLQEKSVLEAAKIVLIGLLMIANFAIAFTLPLYI